MTVVVILAKNTRTIVPACTPVLGLCDLPRDRLFKDSEPLVLTEKKGTMESIFETNLNGRIFDIDL